MNRRLFLAVATLALAACAAAPVQPERHRVVIQVSDADPAKWNLALNNAKNVQTDLGKQNVEVEIVAYGPGIGMLRDESKARDRVVAALDDGVMLVACENTMTNQKLKRDDMIGGIGYAKAGVVELMEKQRQGWAYIRP